jgi:hypothetical protein
VYCRLARPGERVGDVIGGAEGERMGGKNYFVYCRLARQIGDAKSEGTRVVGPGCSFRAAGGT